MSCTRAGFGNKNKDLCFHSRKRPSRRSVNANIFTDASHSRRGFRIPHTCPSCDDLAQRRRKEPHKRRETPQTSPERPPRAVSTQGGMNSAAPKCVWICVPTFYKRIKQIMDQNNHGHGCGYCSNRERLQARSHQGGIDAC